MRTLVGFQKLEFEVQKAIVDTVQQCFLRAAQEMCESALSSCMFLLFVELPFQIKFLRKCHYKMLLT